MPFLIAWGINADVPQTELQELRATLIPLIAEEMGIPENIIQVYFPEDRAGNPSPGQCTTIYGRLDTGLFGRTIFGEIWSEIKKLFGWKDPLQEKKERVTKWIAQAIWNFFDGEYGVEIFIGYLITSGKTHLKAR